MTRSLTAIVLALAAIVWTTPPAAAQDDPDPPGPADVGSGEGGLFPFIPPSGGVARGYITIDNVGNTSSIFPPPALPTGVQRSDTGFIIPSGARGDAEPRILNPILTRAGRRPLYSNFGGFGGPLPQGPPVTPVSPQNQLWGDWFIIDSANGFATNDDRTFILSGTEAIFLQLLPPNPDYLRQDVPAEGTGKPLVPIGDPNVPKTNLLDTRSFYLRQDTTTERPPGGPLPTSGDGPTYTPYGRYGNTAATPNQDGSLPPFGGGPGFLAEVFPLPPGLIPAPRPAGGPQSYIDTVLSERPIFLYRFEEDEAEGRGRPPPPVNLDLVPGLFPNDGLPGFASPSKFDIWRDTGDGGLPPDVGPNGGMVIGTFYVIPEEDRAFLGFDPIEVPHDCGDVICDHFLGATVVLSDLPIVPNYQNFEEEPMSVKAKRWAEEDPYITEDEAFERLAASELRGGGISKEEKWRRREERRIFRSLVREGGDNFPYEGLNVPTTPPESTRWERYIERARELSMPEYNRRVARRHAEWLAEQAAKESSDDETGEEQIRKRAEEAKKDDALRNFIQQYGNKDAKAALNQTVGPVVGQSFPCGGKCQPE